MKVLPQILPHSHLIRGFVKGKTTPTPSSTSLSWFGCLSMQMHLSFQWIWYLLSRMPPDFYFACLFVWFSGFALSKSTFLPFRGTNLPSTCRDVFPRNVELWILCDKRRPKVHNDSQFSNCPSLFSRCMACVIKTKEKQYIVETIDGIVSVETADCLCSIFASPHITARFQFSSLCSSQYIRNLWKY